MKKIIPHIWFDKEAKEATAMYVSIFNNSKINSINTIKDTPSGDCDTVDFTLEGQSFMAISAGPYFKLNPAISFFVVFDKEEEIKNVWDKLVDDGKILMPYNTYPWATKYGWLQDKYGVSWQLSMSENHNMVQKITPTLMFTQDVAGKARDAISDYTTIFQNSKIEMISEYMAGEGDVEGYIKHARFSLDGNNFIAMDSSAKHEFKFNEAISFVITCDTQEEINYYSNKLSAYPEAEQCGWVKDRYGVSWQIVPKIMSEMMASGNADQMARVTQAFLKMKRFDIKTLQSVFEEK